VLERILCQLVLERILCQLVLEWIFCYLTPGFLSEQRSLTVSISMSFCGTKSSRLMDECCH
jgi:hypothetical protein